MYVCICNALTKDELTAIIKDNPNITMDELRDMGIADNCYKCSFETEELLLKHIAEQAKIKDEDYKEDTTGSN